MILDVLVVDAVGIVDAIPFRPGTLGWSRIAVAGTARDSSKEQAAGNDVSPFPYRNGLGQQQLNTSQRANSRSFFRDHPPLKGAVSSGCGGNFGDELRLGD